MACLQFLSILFAEEGRLQGRQPDQTLTITQMLDETATGMNSEKIWELINLQSLWFLYDLKNHYKANFKDNRNIPLLSSDEWEIN